MYVYVPVVSASVDDRVPTSVPVAAVSETVLAVIAISVGALSLTSVIVMVTDSSTSSPVPSLMAIVSV